MPNSTPRISIIAPLYNEEEVFEQLRQRLTLVMDQQPYAVEVVLVNDGSRDRTPELMRDWAQADQRVQAVFLSRNHGHQRALSAGYRFARATDAVLVIDGDLQDPPELLPEFVAKFEEGYDVVYAVRQNRKESYFKKLTYKIYYRLLKRFTNLDLPLDAGDFGLVSRRVVNLMNSMPENYRYLRGLRAWVGFRQYGLTYDRQARAAGKSKYSLRLLFRLAYDGLFSFSEAPIKLITQLGSIVFGLGFVYLIYMIVYVSISAGELPTGFPTLIILLFMFAGIQMISLGLIGEYVLRIYTEVRQRPLFLVAGHIAEGQDQAVSPTGPSNPHPQVPAGSGASS